MNGQFDLSGDRLRTEAVISVTEIVASVVPGHCIPAQLSSSHCLLSSWHRSGPAGPGQLGGGGPRLQGTGELGSVSLVNNQMVAGGQFDDGLHCKVIIIVRIFLRWR